MSRIDGCVEPYSSSRYRLECSCRPEFVVLKVVPNFRTEIMVDNLVGDSAERPLARSRGSSKVMASRREIAECHPAPFGLMGNFIERRASDQSVRCRPRAQTIHFAFERGDRGGPAALVVGLKRAEPFRASMQMIQPDLLMVRRRLRDRTSFSSRWAAPVRIPLR